jgi:Polyketide cyclase / dehydrase and lipid transport
VARETFDMTRPRVLILAAAMVLGTSGAHALEAKVETPLTVDAPSAWAAVGDFCGISKWHPAVTKCELTEKDGKTFRTLTLKDGAKLLEQLIAFDKAGMSYTYAIVDGPLPVANYQSTLSVKSAGNSSMLSWTGTFDAKGAADAEAVKTITGIYQAGAGELAKLK